MLCLSIDTSTKTCSVALIQDNKTLAEITINSETTHSEKLLPAVDMVLKSIGRSLDHVKLLGVAVGPGSFTGLRIGIATAKGLAYGKKIPVVGISTLKALALLGSSENQTIVPILNARRNQVYTGTFKFREEADLYQIYSDRVIKLVELIELLKDIEGELLFIGDGVPAFKDKLKEELGGRAQFMPMFNHFPKASSVGILAIKEYEKHCQGSPYILKPEYLRLSEAERNLAKGCHNG